MPRLELKDYSEFVSLFVPLIRVYNAMDAQQYICRQARLSIVEFEKEYNLIVRKHLLFAPFCAI